MGVTTFSADGIRFRIHRMFSLPAIKYIQSLTKEPINPKKMVNGNVNNPLYINEAAIRIATSPSRKVPAERAV